MIRVTRLFLVSSFLLLFTTSSRGQVAQVIHVGELGQPANTANARTLINRGNAEHAKARYQAAIDYYSRVDAAAGELYARAVYNIGVCYFELYRTEEAIEMYRRAIALSSDGYPNATYALGVALEHLHRRAEAKQAFRDAIVKSKNKHALAYFRLGVITGEEDPEAAAILFREAIARSKEDLPGGHNNLGVMLARRGRFAEAQREFAIALRQSKGEMPEAQHNLQLCRVLMKTRNNTDLVGKMVIK